MHFKKALEFILSNNLKLFYKDNNNPHSSSNANFQKRGNFKVQNIPFSLIF
jgi:hypothetical protein